MLNSGGPSRAGRWRRHSRQLRNRPEILRIERRKSPSRSQETKARLYASYSSPHVVQLFANRPFSIYFPIKRSSKSLRAAVPAVRFEKLSFPKIRTWFDSQRLLHNF